MSNDVTEKYVNQAAQLRQQLTDGKITKSEFDELLADITDLNKLQTKLNKEGSKIKAAKIVDLIFKAAGVL